MLTIPSVARLISLISAQQTGPASCWGCVNMAHGLGGEQWGSAGAAEQVGGRGWDVSLCRREAELKGSHSVLGQDAQAGFGVLSTDPTHAQHPGSGVQDPAHVRRLKEAAGDTAVSILLPCSSSLQPAPAGCSQGSEHPVGHRGHGAAPARGVGVCWGHRAAPGMVCRGLLPPSPGPCCVQGCLGFSSGLFCCFLRSGLRAALLGPRQLREVDMFTSKEMLLIKHQ